MTTFDGENLLITMALTGGVGTVDALADFYVPWKEWAREDTNMKYPQAFAPTGGELLEPGLKSGSYTFLRNDLGWRVRPGEEDATIALTGNFIATDKTLPILIPTVGGFTVGVFGLQPITQNVGSVVDLFRIEDFYTLDNMNFVGTLLTTARKRVFPTQALADAADAAPGGVGLEGAIAAYNVVAVPSGTPGLPSSYSEIRYA
jgi:hypothetical protein